MGLRDHQKKVEARNLVNRLRHLIADADDYDPADTDARDRAEAAKALLKAAEKSQDAAQWQAAIDVASHAIRILEGN